MAEDRPIVRYSLSSSSTGRTRKLASGSTHELRPAGRTTRFRSSTRPARVQLLSNVTDSSRIGNPAHRPPEHLERHDLPGQMNQKRPAHEHRAPHDRAFGPEPRIVGDRAVVAQNEVLIAAEAHRSTSPHEGWRGVLASELV